jgi:hypothetical protein
MERFNRFSGKVLVLGLAVGLGSVMGGFISASAAPTSVKVCALKTTGALRYVKTGNCKANETTLTLGQQGPVGATGATGATGPAGPAGAAGAAASSGIREITLSSDTLVIGDAGKILVTTVATDITVPADATVSFPIGTRIEIARTTGSPTFKGAAGVTVNGISAPGAASFDSGDYQQGVLIKTAANKWVLLKKPD